MFHIDVEKRPSAYNTLQQPVPAHIARPSTFLPTYEETLNDNLRSFGNLESQVNLRAFDLVEGPKRGRRECMKREYLIIGIILLSLCGIALPLGLVYTLRETDPEQETATMQTRRAESSFSLAPSTASILPTAIVPMTVFVTVTPTPQVTVPIVTITVTASGSDFGLDTAESQATDALASPSVSKIATSAVTPPDTTSLQSSSSLFDASASLLTSSASMSTIGPTSRASTASQLSQVNSIVHFTDTTTVVSATTVDPTSTYSSKVLQTAKGRFGFCGVSGQFCKRFRDLDQ